MAIPTSSPYAMIPMNEALTTIANSLSPLPDQRVPVTASLGTVLAEDVQSPGPHPPFRASTKDGYAVALPRSFSFSQPPSHVSDTSFIVRAETVAGANYQPEPLLPGDAAYVTTGAPVPDGAEAVVMVERCRRDGNKLFIDSWPKCSGQDIRDIGSDLAQGQIVLPKGTYIGAAEIGLFATCGITNVLVKTRPIIGVMSTGDEIIDVSSGEYDKNNKLPFGKIIDSNRPMLLASVREALPFCDVKDLGIVSDDFQGVENALRAASEQCHVIVTSGGVSMGSRDSVKPALQKIGVVHFGRVIMKPGKPLTFATLTGRKDRCFVALPGNPVSCFVCFHLAVAVAARRLAGWSSENAAHGVKVQASLSQDLKLDRQRPEYHRAILHWRDGEGYVATSTGKQASSRLLSARSANALLELPAMDSTLPAGTIVRAYLLNSGPTYSELTHIK